MIKRNLIACMGTLALPLAGFLVAASTLNAAGLPDSEQVSKLLSEAKTMAFQLKEDAATMESYTRSNVTWESHAVAITQIKEHVNAMARQVAKLEEARNTASPWQKTVINRINPFMDELEGYTAAIIERVNQRPALLTTPEYKDFLQANADYSADLAAMIGDFVNYGRTKERLQRFADKLELPVR